MKRSCDHPTQPTVFPCVTSPLVFAYLGPKDMQSTVLVNKSWNNATFQAIFSKAENFSEKLDFQFSYKNESPNLIDIKISLLIMKENLLVSMTKLPSERESLPPFFEDFYELAPLYMEFIKTKDLPESPNRNLALEKLFIQLTEKGCTHVVQKYITEVSQVYFKKTFTFLPLIKILCTLADFENAKKFALLLQNPSAVNHALDQIKQSHNDFALCRKVL